MNLVTGATGHLGSHVVLELARAGKAVRAIYRNKDKIDITRKLFAYYHCDTSLFNQVEWVKADINDPYVMADVLKGVNIVFHTAGQVSFTKNKKQLEVNTNGTSNVVNACLEAAGIKLIHISSIATLGQVLSDIPLNESNLWNNDTSSSAYSISKYKGEMEVWRGIFEGLDAVILNPSVIIGPGMNFGPAAHLFDHVRKGQKFYTGGTSGYVDVRDVAKIMMMVSDNSITGERFIVSSGNFPHRHILNLLADGFGQPHPKYEVTPLIARIAVILEGIRSLITFSDARINRKALQIAGSRLQYSNDKITKWLSFDFMPPEHSVRDAVDFYNFFFNSRVTI